MKQAVYWKYLAIAVTTLLVGIGAHAQGVGATVAWTEYEAESGTLAGGATVQSLSGPPTTPYSSPQLEASGRSYVQLTGTGQSVTWTNNTGTNITALNIRYSVPDSSSGGGTAYTLDLYVNGTLRQAVSMTSKQTWQYDGTAGPGGALYDTSDQNPSDGNPRDFFDEVHFLVTGAAIAPGNSIMLKKDAANSAAFYYIDLIDLEAPTALSQPSNSLSITNSPYNAVPNNSSSDSTTAIQHCINDAKSQGKTVWVPMGIFYLNTQTGLTGTGVTIQGAGMWYSTIYHNVSLPSPPTGTGAVFDGDSCTIQNVCLDSDAASGQHTDGLGGGINMAGTNWLINSVWVQHTSSGLWAGGVGGTVENSRMTCTWGDGIDLNNTQGGSAGLVGNNLTARNNFVRGSGDDAMALNSTNFNGSTFYQNMTNTTVVNNTSMAPWGGKALGIYGGNNDVVENNYLVDTPRYIGLAIGQQGNGNNGSSINNALITGNTILRCGGNGYSQQQSAVVIGDGVGGVQNPSFPESAINVHFSSNTISNSIFGSVEITPISNLVLENNTINTPGLLFAMTIDSNAVGNAVLDGNSITNVGAGIAAFANNSVNFDASSSIAASSYTSESGGIGAESCSEGGNDIGFIQNGSYSVYSVNLSGMTNFIARVASAASGGNIALHLDSPTGTLIGTCAVTGTGGWQNWTDVNCTINAATGTHNVYLVYTGGSGYLFNVEWLAFDADLEYMEASDYSSVSGGIGTQGSNEGGENLDFITNGSYAVYNSVNLTGATSFNARISSAGTGGNIQIREDSSTGTLLGTCVVPANTGGWSTWATIFCTLSGASGTHNLYLVFTGGGGDLFNLEWFSFDPSVSQTAASNYSSVAGGIGTQSCSEGGLNLEAISNGSYAVYNNVNLNGAASFQGRVASAASGGNIIIHLDSPTGTVIGTCPVAGTGGWQTWTTQACNLSGASGTHNLYLVFTGGSNSLMNLEWFGLVY